MFKRITLTLAALTFTLAGPAFAQDLGQDLYEEAFPTMETDNRPLQLFGSAGESFVGSAILVNRANSYNFAERDGIPGGDKRKFARKQNLKLAAGVALLSDGGARLLVVLNGRNPSYSPSISLGSTAVKRMISSPAATPETHTSMSVE